MVKYLRLMVLRCELWNWLPTWLSSRISNKSRLWTCHWRLHCFSSCLVRFNTNTTKRRVIKFCALTDLSQVCNFEFIIFIFAAECKTLLLQSNYYHPVTVCQPSLTSCWISGYKSNAQNCCGCSKTDINILQNELLNFWGYWNLNVTRIIFKVDNCYCDSLRLQLLKHIVEQRWV
jgi:hypothetical protein